jgi:hypothetical protein
LHGWTYGLSVRIYFFNVRREAMRTKMLLLALLLASVMLPAAPASACPAGYRLCGSYCCR